MEEYKTNSDKSRQEQSEKKVEAVISGKAKTRKKGEMQKFADVFIAEDANNVKSYTAHLKSLKLWESLRALCRTI